MEVFGGTSNFEDLMTLTLTFNGIPRVALINLYLNTIFHMNQANHTKLLWTYGHTWPRTYKYAWTSDWLY